jgi:hypothetical protein
MRLFFFAETMETVVGKVDIDLLVVELSLE